MTTSKEYSRSYEVLWVDLDPHWHLRHTAYTDYSAEIRLRFFTEHNFPASRFREAGFSPIIFSETSLYFKEVLVGETITITLHLLHLSPDGTHWSVQHNIFKPNRQKAASLKVEGAWIDMQTKNLVPPPPELFKIMHSIPLLLEEAPYIDTPDRTE